MFGDFRNRNGDVPLEEFDIPGSSADRLREIIANGKKHLGHGVPPSLQPLMTACSAELYRRRLKGEA